MKRSFTVLSLIFILLPLVSRAQSLTNAERRHINSRILSVVEEYERYSNLYDDEAEFYFENMFAEGGQSIVYCDLLGLPEYQKDITVAEYMELIRKHSMNTSIIIKDVAKGNMTYENGVWNVPVSFRKALFYIDQAGYVFSADEYYGTDFDMTMHVSYYPDSDRCLIRSITGTLDSAMEFPQGRFFIVEKPAEEYSRNSKYLSTLTIDGEPLKFNQFGHAFLPNGVFEVDDPDVEVQTETAVQGHNYDVLSFKFIPRNTRIRLRYGFAPFAYSVKGLGENVTDRSNAMEIGADLGFVFPVGERSKMSFNFGVGLSRSMLHLSYNPLNPKQYTYDFVKNPINGMFQSGKVDYKISSASESVRYTDAFVPVYFEVEHMVSKDVMLSWNMGAKVYFCLGAEAVKPYTLDATATIDGSTDKVVLASDSAKGTYFIEANSYAKSSLEFSAMANLGVDVNLHKRRVYAMARVGYEYGLNAYQSMTSIYMSGSGIPVIYASGIDKNQHVAVNSLISGVSFNRSSLWISVGVKFKL